MKLFTIGFTKKTSQKFFTKLVENGVTKVIDIRLNNKSQLAGFTKGDDLKYFLKAIGNIEYIYKPGYAPTKELLNEYRDNKITWEEYESGYLNMLRDREILKNIDWALFDNSCLLCSEATPEQCHRRLLAEYLKNANRNIEIIHL